MQPLKLWDNQKETVQRMQSIPRGLNASDPGTGKTISVLSYALANGLRTLVLAPKTLLETAWSNDLKHNMGIDDFTVAWAHNRQKAFDNTDAQFTITNLEAVNWLADKSKKQRLKYLQGYDLVVCDESTAFKNYAAARSKNARIVFRSIPEAWCMSGTPMTKTVQNIWHQVFLLDHGDRLGSNISTFRFNFCTPVAIPGAPAGAINWEDKPGAKERVAELIADITVRYTLDECQSIPPNHLTWIFLKLQTKTRNTYVSMQQHAVAQLSESTLLRGVNAAAARNKLLQICSGAVYYDTDKNYEVMEQTRYELIAELVENRAATVVFFLWHHQRDQIIDQFVKRKIKFGLIDGTTPAEKRGKVVDDLQKGLTQVVLLHPETGAHGITLTRAKTVIFCSPPGDRPDWMTQGIARVRRGGQTEKTETILLCSENTLEEKVYQATLDEKDTNEAFVEYLKSLTG